MTKDREDLKQALVDVRKAFRLLWLYQRRVTDIVDTITDEFDHEFYCWDSMCGRPPGQTRTDPMDDYWTWSMLFGYQLCLLYLPRDAVYSACDISKRIGFFSFTESSLRVIVVKPVKLIFAFFH